MSASTSAMLENTSPRLHDKLNGVDFRWFVARSLPHQERKLASLLLSHREAGKNILEVFCPTHTTVSVRGDGREEQRPLFAGFVFVLATQQAVASLLGRYYPDGARSEGLVAAYYLAHNMGEDALAKNFLKACKLAAKSQFSLFNCEEYTFAHKNPKRSLNAIRFKNTRQWVRVDSIQHVACFFIRLYWTENKPL